MMISKEIRINQRSMELYKKMALQSPSIEIFVPNKKQKGKKKKQAV